MQRAHKPAETHVGHDELNTLKRSFSTRPVIEEQQDSSRDLDGEEKKRHPAEVVPDRMSMDRDCLLGRKQTNGLESKPLVQPHGESIPIGSRLLHCFDTTMSSPERF